MEWKQLFKSNILNGGEEYASDGSVVNLQSTNRTVTALVKGIEDFSVNIEFGEDSVKAMHCSCPYAGAGNNCKHEAAVLFAWEKSGAVNPVVEDIQENEIEIAAEEKANPSEVSNNNILQIAETAEQENNNDIEVISINDEGSVHVDSEDSMVEYIDDSEEGENINEPVEQEAPQIENISFIPSHDGTIEMIADVNGVFTYALQQNHVALVRSVTIKNTSEKDVENISLRIKSDVDLIETYEETIDILQPGEEKTFKNFKIKVHGNYLASLTERVSCLLYISVTQDLFELASKSEEITVLAYDQWPGLRYDADLLAAYVTPNHPAIAGLMQNAAKWLEKWTGSPSLDGYQSLSRGDADSSKENRIVSMVCAAYAAIQEKNITYAEPPASYEDVGQRVRLADDILSSRLGTCMDMTLLYAGLLEAMGLNALLIMVKGHIFAGVWLVDDTFPDPCTDDPTQLEKRVADGVNEIILVECTAMCAGKTISFDEAKMHGLNNVADYSAFEFAIDLTRARRSGVRPLPIRIKGDNGYTVEQTDRDEKSITAAPQQEVNIIDWLNNNDQSSKVTKQTQWERKLLDLSMRNMLINMRVKNSVVPLLVSDVSNLEDNLSEGIEYEVLSRPKEWDIHDITVGDVESVGDLGPYADLISLEIKHHRIHAWMSEGELNKILTKMYRSAKTSMEENGASTLYMTMGMLRWFDGIKTPKVHHAPIVLVPVDIIRKSASKGYVIRKRDDDAQINITLLEFLKQNFNMDIPGLNPPPMDEHGIDIEKVFAIFRHAIMNQKIWNILENSFIGNFSFSQFVMWNDMHSRADLLKKNRVVNALMEGAIDWDTTIPENVDTDDAYLPVSVDASQLRAINMAANDVSFVLHGPPGTGKSQTITAMISNALTKGKTVLFVAEKMAALEVVQKRLASLGIEDFCLELHSNKAVKKNVLEQLKRGLDIKVWGLSTDYDKKIEELHQMRMELDEYVKKLHERKEFGMSVRELIDVYETIPEYEERIRFQRAWIETLDQNALDNHRRLLERLVSAGRVIGHPKGNVFAQVRQTEYSQSLRIGLEDGLYDYQKAIDSVIQLGDIPEFILKDEFGGQEVEALEEYEIKKKYIFERKSEILKKWTDKILDRDLSSVGVQFTNHCTQRNNDKTELDEIGASFVKFYLMRHGEYEKIKESMLEKWQESFLQMSMFSYFEDIEAAKKKFIGKKKAIDTVVDTVKRYATFQVTADNIENELNAITEYQKKQKEADAFENSVTEFVSAFMDGNGSIDALCQMFEDRSQEGFVNSNLDIHEYSKKTLEIKHSLSNVITEIDGILRSLQEIANFTITEDNIISEVEDAIKFQNENNEFMAISAKISNEARNYVETDGSIGQLQLIIEAITKLRDKENNVANILQMRLVTTGENWIEQKKGNCKLFLSHLSELKDWISFREIMQECEDADLEDICELYTNGLSHEKVLDVYFKSVYRAIIMATIEREPVLNRFNGTSFNEKIKQYKKLEQEFIDLTKEEMYYKLTHQLPTGRESIEMSKELAILRKAISSGGRGLSIRTLFDQIPHVLTKLCPCLLMSPISVAQYLSVDNDLFDIVIFDEASQLPTCKAVGVLARGKNAVIVGDPNQMPPTSFFAGNMIDEDNLDIEDLDSILDDCLALGMPDTHLQWHYRSRHESLIAFSNQEYYENSMLTFPSVNDRERRVKLCTVDGTFNRKKGRINEEEGKAVVKEILRRYKDEELKKQSIGVVTFNISQQGLIEDLLAEEFRKDTEFDTWANEREEALFVKNLENVQGDERDIILFSVGFGPDEDGKLSLNFGPLNKEGGWKRLNVAVSRARSEMIVFSSMLPEMIDLNRTKAKGVEGLRDFLDFADKGRLSSGFATGQMAKRRGIQNQIIKAIEEQGLKCQKDVGHSDFKIDIAVVNPYDEDEYLLGILLDGDTYKRSTNTKDRELSQISVLGGLGWELHRIWAMDWWDNKDKELSHILKLVDDAKEKAKIATEQGIVKDIGPESEEITKKIQSDTKKESTRKKKDKIEGNSSFDTHERFAPKIPHMDSKDELDEFVEENKNSDGKE